MGTAHAATAVTPLTAAPSLHERPTPGAIRWAHAAIALRGHAPGQGIVCLGSQLELASDMGMSRGTVGRHLRVLGPIAVETVPVQIDTDLLHDAGGPSTPRPGALPHPPAASTPDAQTSGDERLLQAAAALIDSVTALIDAIAAKTQPGPIAAKTQPGPDRPNRKVRTAHVARRDATRRDAFPPDVAPSVASVASVAPVSQSGLFPVQDKETDCLTDSSPIARGATDRATSRRVAPTQDRTDQLTTDEVTELLQPLIKTCRQCQRSDKVDSRGYAPLRQLREDELRYGISRIVRMTRDGELRSPMHFLVAQAQNHANGDAEFFERPRLDDLTSDTPAAPDDAGGRDAVDDDDPLDALSPEQLAAIDAQIKGRHTMGTRALDSIRRQHARELRGRQTGGSGE